MDITRLRQFVALADTLHFSKAAERCNTSPSTLSRAIQQLEQDAGCQLFERDNRSVAITRTGKQFLAFAQGTLQQWEILQHSLQAQTGQLQGALSIYCSVTASYSFLYDILADFRKQHPLIEIRLHTGDPALAIERVQAGHEDIAIAARLDTMPPSLSFKRIARSPLVFVQPQNSQTLPDEAAKDFWQTVPLILSERGLARERLDRWFRSRHISPNIYAQVAGHEAIVSMVSLGFGVGLIPQIVLDNSPLADKVKPLAKQPLLKPYEVGLCVQNSRLKSPVIQAFWEQVSQG